MRFLLLMLLLLLPLPLLAEELPWFVAPSTSVTVVHPLPGIDVLTDLHGHSATILEPAPGLHWYSARDPQGNITAQGFLFDPMPAHKPLSVPAFIPPPLYQSK